MELALPTETALELTLVTLLELVLSKSALLTVVTPVDVGAAI